MSKYKFLCLDDEDAVQSLIRTLNRKSSRIHIEWGFPKTFTQQIEQIIALDKDSSIDGLMLDLRLDQSVGDNGESADYRAGALAQQIRTLATEKKISAFPIFLWSIDAKLSKSFNKDNTSQMLFDMVILKGELPDNASLVEKRLASVAKAYKDIAASLKKSNSFFDLLQLPEADRCLMNPRIGEEFAQGPKSFPVHVYASYILNEIILMAGPLIDESLLCARLGLDSNQSSLSGLFENLDAKCQYEGPFGDAWKRWWWPLVEKWWLSLDEHGKPMTSLPAPDRVDVLKKKLKLKGLVAAKPYANGYGQYFSTVCQALEFPLDPIDGFVIASSGMKPWQDKCYLSREAALNRSKYNVRVELDPFEKERLQSYKKPS